MVFWKTYKNTYKHKISVKHLCLIDNFKCGPSEKFKKIRGGIIREQSKKEQEKRELKYFS